MPKFPKQRPKALDKRDKTTAALRELADLKRRVRERDRLCRICHRAGYDAHHIQFRSRGGSDSMGNLVLLCARCHVDVHQHVIKLSGTALRLKVARWSDASGDWDA